MLLRAKTSTDLESIQAKKVRAVAFLASLPITTEVVSEQLSLKRNNSSCEDGSPVRGLALMTPSGATITYSNTMIQVLASLSSTCELLGRTSIQAAQVDGWLTYLWHSLELPLHVLGHSSVFQDPSKIVKVQAAIEQSLKRVSEHLSSRKHFVGSGVTLADVSFVLVWKYEIEKVSNHSETRSNGVLQIWAERIWKECGLEEFDTRL